MTSDFIVKGIVISEDLTVFCGRSHGSTGRQRLIKLSEELCLDILSHFAPDRERSFFAQHAHLSVMLSSEQLPSRECSDCVLFCKATSPGNKSVPASKPLDNTSILILVDEDYEDLEFWYPKLRLIEAGARVTVAGPTGKKHFKGKHGYPASSDKEISTVQAADFQGVVVPGGWAPDKLRRDPHVLQLIREFNAMGKLIAAICHGGWVPISAGVYRGVRVTGSPGIKDDLVNAGAIWEDAPVVVDRHFVSSRRPDDLPDFCAGILQVMAVSRC
jgi:protease I